jgi:hypothetical protein
VSQVCAFSFVGYLNGYCLDSNTHAAWGYVCVWKVRGNELYITQQNTNRAETHHQALVTLFEKGIGEETSWIY